MRRVSDILCKREFIMLEEGLYTDLTLHAQGGSIKAHQFVLASSSPVFHTVFRRLQLHGRHFPLPRAITIPEMTISALQLLVLLLYTIDKETFVTEVFQAAMDRHFSEIFCACCKYNIMQLVPCLNTTLQRILTPSNAWHWFKRCSDAHRWFSNRGEEAFHSLPSTCLDYINYNSCSLI